MDVTQDKSTVIGLASGLIGGMGKYLLQLHTPFLLNIMGAIIIAFLSGAAGIAGGEAFKFLKKFFIKKTHQHGRAKR